MNDTSVVYLDNSGTIAKPTPPKPRLPKCPVCGRTFATERGLRQHWRYLHRKPEAPDAAHKEEG